LPFEELKEIERRPDGAPVSAEDLVRLPVFKEISPQFLKKNANATVWRHFRAGDIVCREGEFGSTAFYILEGTASVELSAPIAHVKAQRRPASFFAQLTSKLTSRLAARQEDRREEEADRRSIPIDAPVDLAYEHPVAELGPGELFGEMTCMNYYPRSATVRAKSDCTMLEMLRNVLDVLQKSKTFRAQLDETYRRRALDSHLRDVAIFRGLAPDFIDRLRDRVQLMRFAPGQAICKQGDPADSFYLVRLGFVKVSEDYPGGELVLAYLSRGDYFGEIGLLGSGTRTATCSALDHVEVVRISADDFRAMVENYPDVKTGLERIAREREQSNRERLRVVRDVPLDSFLAQGLMEAQSLLVLDLEKCTRCDACVKACADSHEGVTRLVREGLRFENFLVATSCRQCRDPLCMVGCPVGAIRRRNSLEVIIEDWCIGCSLCAKNCPYGNINMHSFPASNGAQPEAAPVAAQTAALEHATPKKAVVQKKATTCDLCSDLAEPSCVYACPHDAAHRVEPRDFFAQSLGQRLGRSGGRQR
jgi:CRP-like cAMP-binding protein/Fe-S-cluster-containing hydrogenase component 2